MLIDISEISPLTGCHWKDLSNHNQDDVLLNSYIPISKRDFLSLTKNDTSFFVTPDKKTIVTCTIHDNLFVISPLKPKYVNEILQLHLSRSVPR